MIFAGLLELLPLWNTPVTCVSSRFPPLPLGEEPLRDILS